MNEKKDKKFTLVLIGIVVLVAIAYTPVGEMTFDQLMKLLEVMTGE